MFQILVMDNQSYFDLLQSGDTGLNDLRWTQGHEEQPNDLEGHEEQHIDLEGRDEEHIDLEGTQQATPRVKARTKKAKSSKASASTSNAIKRQKNFSKAEDLTLCDAYLEITQDPIIGVDQSRDCYWKRINAYFHANKTEDSDRTQSSLQHRWDFIKEHVSKFCACYAQVINRNQSGMTRDNKVTHMLCMVHMFASSCVMLIVCCTNACVSMQLAQALVKYANDDKAHKSFGLMHCFTKLEDTEKWKSRTQLKKQKTSSMDTPGSCASVFEDEATSPSKRPIGNKRAKVAAKRANSSSNTGGSSAMESLGGMLESRESKRQERFELMMAMDKQREEERLVEERNKLALKEKKVALEEEKIHIMRMAEERMTTAEESRIMSLDISGMAEDEQEFYKLRKSQIIKRHRNLS
jgi:hypothetical protein